jgi:probable F420-dependent oxidoreductase
LPGVRYSIGLPQALPASDVTRFARRAEELGFTGLWTMDSVIGGATGHNDTIDGLHLLSYVAAVTESIDLGIAVIVLPLRNPLLLARELASIDRLSGGRLTVGVGLGIGDEERAARLGFPSGRPVRRLVENVEILRAAWTQPEASFDGELYRFADLPLEPKPTQQPHPPIWIGARTERALRRAVRIGDGWIGSGSSSVDDFIAQSATVREAIAASGRDPATFPIAKRVYVAVGDGKQLQEGLDAMYTWPGLGERVAVAGSPDQIAEQLTRLREAGAQELLLHPIHDHFEQLEALADLVGLKA